MSTKPVIVIVPGAWSSPAFYSQMQSYLTELGFPSELAMHPSIGAEPANKTLEDDIANLRRILTRLSDSGNEILILAHSYGGLVSSSAVEGFQKSERQCQGKTGGVAMIIYMVAFVVPKGQSVVAASGGNLMPWIKTEGNYTYCDIGADGAFHDLPPQEQETWIAALRHTALPVFSGVVSYEPWHSLPTAYILGEEDRMLPLSIQEGMAKMLGTPHMYRLKSSHHPFLSMPKKVAEIIDELEMLLQKEVQ
ncbi:hypothetical protein ETB97_005954 [Aspergillus alliaceus]|uniref:AB hydrolase-1 domain-containing protein n=1 Tax=Petromyces alliaceus TaxID=209559 RepID=A0A8H6E2V2_PETAA|nr:hypothetical protein ETB97_005954 [Aspergillus burnettii]